MKYTEIHCIVLKQKYTLWSCVYIYIYIYFHMDSGGSDRKASAYSVGDTGSIPGSGRSSGEGNANPLQYSCLEKPVDGGVW